MNPPSPDFPAMAIARQRLYRSTLANAREAIRFSLEQQPLAPPRRAGETVAVAVGSRRIDKLAETVWECLRFLEHKGYAPFIVPAMGSHGGATAEGQKGVLAAFGISEKSMGAPIHGDMGVRAVARHPQGFDLLVSEAALAADHLVLINRVKPHTKFTADIESGLCKMMTIGLGKHAGAALFHSQAVAHSFRIIETAAAVLLNQLPLLFGLALLEDGYGKLAHVETLVPNQLIRREKELLVMARSMMGRIPLDPLDILVIDEIGKDISGIGMDSNVTGRHRDLVGDSFGPPHARRIFVRDLSPGSFGNANGIGLADVTTRRLVEKMDREKTYVNALAAISPEKAAIPMYFDTDRACLAACAGTCGRPVWKDLRMVRIKNTARLERLLISRSLETQALEAGMDLLTPFEDLVFDAADQVLEFPSP